MQTRLATEADAAAIAEIYNQGIADRTATFETRPRTADEVRGWFAAACPIVAVEESGRVIAFAAASPYCTRACYAGIAEFSVYVARDIFDLAPTVRNSPSVSCQRVYTRNRAQCRI